MPAQIVAVAERCASDGGHSIVVAPEIGSPFEVVIPAQQLGELVRHFQLAAIHRAEAEVENAVLPELTVEAVRLGHQGPKCELMVSIHQLGTVMLILSDDLLRHAKAEIDRVLAYRGGSSAQH